MKWEIVKDFIPEEKYLIIHKEEFNAIFPWHRKYYGRYKGYRVFVISYGYDYILNETLKSQRLITIHPDYSYTVYKMIRTGQSSMERRSYEMVLQNLIHGILVPSFL